MSKKRDYIELGEGLAIYKLVQSKNWYIYLWDKKEKKAIRRSLGISNKEEAEHEARFLKTALERGLEGTILSSPSKLVKTIVKDLISQLEKDRSQIKKNHEADKTKNKKGVSTNNQYKEKGRYIAIYREFIDKLGNINIKDLDYAHLLVYYDEYNNKVSTTQIRYMNQAVNKIFKHCLKERLINSIPQIPKIKSKVSETGKYFNNSDFKSIVDRIKSRKRVKKVEKENNQLLLQAFLFTTETGIRPGNELINIQGSDLSVEKILGNKYWTLQIKGGKRAEKDGVKRKIVISEKAILCLKMIMQNHLNESAEAIADGYFLRLLKDNKDRYLFRRQDGHIPDYTTLFGNLRNEIYDDLNEKDLVMYSCRHTFITNQLKRGANENIVAKHCGTSTDMLNKHYNHLLSMMKPNELLDETYSVNDEFNLLPHNKYNLWEVAEEFIKIP